MPRAIWSGAISFGLVNIPIKLYSAVSSKTVRFNQIDAKTGSKVKQKRVAVDDDGNEREVDYSEIVKGYELSPGSYVTIDPTELESLDPKAQRTIEIEEFVDLVDIDPIYFDSPYQVAPAAGAAKPYSLLVEAMEASGKVAIARFVMRTKEYLGALRAKDGRLLLSTMNYADEIVGATEIPEYDQLGDIEVSDKERAMAEQLIASLEADFEPDKYRDTYRERVLELIEQKASGQELVAIAPSEDGPDTVVDLMAALEESVKEAKASRQRHPTSGDEDDGASGEAKAAARKKKSA